MGLDRFVYWTDKTPTFAEVRTVLEDYLGEAGIVKADEGHDSQEGVHAAHLMRINAQMFEGPIRALAKPAVQLWVTLRGAPSYPLRRVAPEHSHVAVFAELAQDPRCFEVYVGENYLDVITRFSDEYTKVVADGFAALVARFWKGRREET